MEKLFNRVYVMLCMLVLHLKAFAQTEDDDADALGPSPGKGGKTSGGESDIMDGYMDYQPIRFDLDDVVMVVLLLVACYVFGKIWKGCSYLLLILAALLFYMTRY